MRFGKWRGLSLALALAAIVGMGSSRVRADGWHLQDTLPREVPAYDFATGGPYYAPPVPYGHYAKDSFGDAAKGVGVLHGCLKGLWDKSVGLFHCCGEGCGHGMGHGCGGHGCGGMAASDCGFCSGRGLFSHGGGCGGGIFDHGTAGAGHKKHFAPCHASTVVASSQVQPAAQAVVSPTGQSPCGDPGCKIGGIHSHFANKGHCGLCGGSGCGACGLGKHGHGGSGCGLCGGKGCSSCLAGLGSKAHGLLGRLSGSALGLLHRDKFDWFVGPGGPVPLTPGYVPYIVTTRSPRDFFAFPPMNPNDP